MIFAFDKDRALICISSLGVHIGFVFGLYNAKLDYIGEYELGNVVSWKLWLRGSLLSISLRLLICFVLDSQFSII